MELIDYIRILQRRRRIFLLTAAITFVVVAIGAISLPSTYTATTRLRILTAVTGGLDFREYDIPYADRLMNTYKEIATSEPVLRELGVYDLSPAPGIELVILADTELLEINIADQDPLFATNLANQMAELLAERSREYLSENVSTLTVTVQDPATIPEDPSGPNRPLLLFLGLVVGLGAATGLAFLFESLDTRLHTVRQIETFTNLNTIGDIPEDITRPGDKDYLFDSRLHIEAFRRLRTNLFAQVAKDEDLHKILVTSTVAADGKSAVAANLAVSTSLTNRRVLVVDADLRNPTLHDYFGLENTAGLSDILYSNESFDSVVRETNFPGLNVITSGSFSASPAELLSSPRMMIFMQLLSEQWDIVFFDSPASLSVTDSAVLAPIVDGVLVVVRQGWVRREKLQSTLDQLETVNANLVGVVVNQTQLGVESARRARKNAPALESPAATE